MLTHIITRFRIPKLFSSHNEPPAPTKRRRYPRRKSLHLIKWLHGRHGSKHKHADTTEYIANSLNISEGGLQFTCRKKLELHTILAMVINIAEKNIQIPVDVQVMWVRRMSSTSRFFRYGVSFLSIREHDRVLLRELAHQQPHKRS